MQTITLKIDGMTCQGCVKSVQTALSTQTGVQNATVSLEQHQATITFDEQIISVAALRELIEDKGFDVHE